MRCAGAGARRPPRRCSPQVYDDVPPRMHPVAMRSLIAHLLKLRDDAAVDEADGRWVLRG